MHPLLEQCRWPNLDPHYDVALRAAVSFIADNFKPLGVIASGTILRGTPDASSDLDIYVIHGNPTYQRVQKFFNNVPAEIFVNPPAKILDYFQEEQASGRPLTAHMLATGFVVLDLDPVVEELRSKARLSLSGGPTTSQEHIEMVRYSTACVLEDASDVKDRDPATANMLLSVCIIRMLHQVFRERKQFLPREKDLIKCVQDHDPEL